MDNVLYIFLCLCPALAGFIGLIVLVICCKTRHHTPKSRPKHQHRHNPKSKHKPRSRSKDKPRSKHRCRCEEVDAECGISNKPLRGEWPKSLPLKGGMLPSTSRAKNVSFYYNIFK